MGKGPRQSRSSKTSKKNTRTGSIGGTTDNPWIKSNSAGQPSRNIHKKKSKEIR